MSYHGRLSEQSRRAQGDEGVMIYRVSKQFLDEGFRAMRQREIEQSRRAQDYVDDGFEDGFGLLACGMGIVGVIIVVVLIWRALG